jgi:hypothetical protein
LASDDSRHFLDQTAAPMTPKELLRADYLKLLTDSGLEIPAIKDKQAVIDELREELLQDDFYGEEETRARREYLSALSQKGVVAPGSENELYIISDSIELLIQTLSQKPAAPIYCGVSPLGAFNAEVHTTPNGVLVLINSALLTLVDRTCTILAHLVDVTSYESDSQNVRKRSQSSLIRLYTLTILDYIAHRRGKNKTSGLTFTKSIPSAPLPAWIICKELAYWITCFIVAHECWHVLQPDFGKTAANKKRAALPMIESWAEELEADEFAARMVLISPSLKSRRMGAAWTEWNNIAAEVRLAAPFVFLHLSQLIRDVSTVSAHPFNQVLYLSHPYLGQRLHDLKSSLQGGPAPLASLAKRFTRFRRKSNIEKWFKRKQIQEEQFRLEALFSGWLEPVRPEVLERVEHHFRGEFLVKAARGDSDLQPIVDHHNSATLFVLPDFLTKAAAHPTNLGYSFTFSAEGGSQQFDNFLSQKGRRFRRLIDIPDPAEGGFEEGMRFIRELYGTQQAECEGYTELKQLVDQLIASKHPPTMIAALASMNVDLEYYKEALEDGATAESARYDRLDEQRMRLSAAIHEQKLAEPRAWNESKAHVPAIMTAVMKLLLSYLAAAEAHFSDANGECESVLEKVLEAFGWFVTDAPFEGHAHSMVARWEDRTAVGSASRVTFSFKMRAEQNNITIEAIQHSAGKKDSSLPGIVFTTWALAKLIYESQAKRLDLNPKNCEAVVQWCNELSD